MKNRKIICICSPVNIQHIHLVSSLPADILVPKGGLLSTGTMLATRLDQSYQSVFKSNDRKYVLYWSILYNGYCDYYKINFRRWEPGKSLWLWNPLLQTVHCLFRKSFWAYCLPGTRKAPLYCDWLLRGRWTFTVTCAFPFYNEVATVTSLYKLPLYSHI